jgi:cytochrome c biogenesis protein CcmG, thiol:disulfide interchange protein DsbE
MALKPLPPSAGPRRRALLATALAGLAADAQAQPDGGPTDERPADKRLAALELPDAAGRPHPVFLPAAAATWVDFWASWCTPCRLSFPWMNGLHDTLAPRGLRIVAINLDARRADAERFLAAHPARFLCLFDTAAESARRFAVRGMPSSLLFGRRGELIASHIGFRLSEAAGLEARIRAALSEGSNR